MEKKNMISPFRPKDKFYMVTVLIESENPDNGKVKKLKEVHLVDAVSPTEIEQKVGEVMDGTIYPWRIINIAENKIQFVY